MPPLVARLRIDRARDGRSVKLWLPLFVLWLLLLPIAIVTLPVIAVVVAGLGRNPFAIFAAYWGVLCALCGAQVEIDTRRAVVFVHVH